MKLRKFPVTAPSGREYEAVIERRYGGLGAYAIHFEVYEWQEVRNWRGKTRTKRICVGDRAYWEAEVTDLIAIVTEIVSLTEERKFAEEERLRSFREFDTWDGRIAE